MLGLDGSIYSNIRLRNIGLKPCLQTPNVYSINVKHTVTVSKRQLNMYVTLSRYRQANCRLGWTGIAGVDTDGVD